MKYIEWIKVNPAGNITCLVLTRFSRELYMEIAKKILAIPGQGFEQVGFIVDENTLEMAGLEFCGNASRAFALWSVKKQGFAGERRILVKVSGIEKPLEVIVNTETNYTKASMPLPEKVETIHEGAIPECPKILRVDLGGIMHFVVLDIGYSESTFTTIKNYGMKHF